MTQHRIIRGPLLNPQDDGTVQFIPDAALFGDADGRIEFVGEWTHFAPRVGADAVVHRSDGIVCPPFLDAHIHIPQHPIRGHFMDGVEPDPPGGRLIAGLNRNVFPAEAKCADEQYTRQVVQQFLDDTLRQGVIGGAAYMTVHCRAAEIALEMLPQTWLVGMVLMNRNCPEYLRTDEANLERDLTDLCERFGRRCILTDRFAVAVDSNLRRRALKIADRYNLIAQTHLNEQIAEKRFVEQTLHPDAGSYTHVYTRDGLLNRSCILGHCIHMRNDEFELLRAHNAMIAHCPTSNTLLGSGIMDLNRVGTFGIDYAICTDVGASPTTSLLAEMAQFLKVHAGRSTHATPSEALYRTTMAPATMLHLDSRLGSFQVNKDLSFIEIQPAGDLNPSASADEIIERHLLEMTNHASDALREELHRLKHTDDRDPPDLDALARDVHSAANQLERKVIRVCVRGTDLHRPAK